MAVKKLLAVAGLVVTAAAVVIMFLPTYATTWSVEGGNKITNGPWYDFLLIAYFNVVPIICMAGGFVMAAGLVVGLVRGRVRGWVAVPGVLAATLLALFGYDSNSAWFVTEAGVWVAPLLAVAALAATASWWVGKRATV